MTSRITHFAWGLFIGALIGCCGLIWCELYDVFVGVARSLGVALCVIAVCGSPGDRSLRGLFLSKQ